MRATEDKLPEFTEDENGKLIASPKTYVIEPRSWRGSRPSGDSRGSGKGLSGGKAGQGKFLGGIVGNSFEVFTKNGEIDLRYLSSHSGVDVENFNLVHGQKYARGWKEYIAIDPNKTYMGLDWSLLVYQLAPVRDTTLIPAMWPSDENLFLMDVDPVKLYIGKNHTGYRHWQEIEIGGTVFMVMEHGTLYAGHPYAWFEESIGRTSPRWLNRSGKKQLLIPVDWLKSMDLYVLADDYSEIAEDAEINGLPPGVMYKLARALGKTPPYEALAEKSWFARVEKWFIAETGREDEFAHWATIKTGNFSYLTMFEQRKIPSLAGISEHDFLSLLARQSTERKKAIRWDPAFHHQDLAFALWNGFFATTHHGFKVEERNGLPCINGSSLVIGNETNHNGVSARLIERFANCTKEDSKYDRYPSQFAVNADWLERNLPKMRDMRPWDSITFDCFGFDPGTKQGVWKKGPSFVYLNDSTQKKTHWCTYSELLAYLNRHMSGSRDMGEKWFGWKEGWIRDVASIPAIAANIGRLRN